MPCDLQVPGFSGIDLRGKAVAVESRCTPSPRGLPCPRRFLQRTLTSPAPPSIPSSDRAAGARILARSFYRELRGERLHPEAASRAFHRAHRPHHPRPPVGAQGSSVAAVPSCARPQGRRPGAVRHSQDERGRSALTGCMAEPICPSPKEASTWLDSAINGFGRIGRCILRAAIERGENLEVVAHQRHRQTPKTLAHLLQVRLGARRLRRQGHGHRGRASSSTARRSPSPPRRIPAKLPLEGARRRRGAGVHGPLHRPREARASTSRPARRRCSSPRPPRARTSRSASASTTRSTTRRSTTSSPTRRAPPTASRRWPRCCMDSFGIEQRADDHHPPLHQRPAHPRPAAQGPAPRARRRPVA